MKSVLCIMMVCSSVLLLHAQNSPAVFKKPAVNNWQTGREPQSLQFTQKFLDLRAQLQSNQSSGGSRAVNTVPIGSAGNLYTILNSTVNRVAGDPNLNTVVFIHRSNPAVFPTSNLGQYRYDISADGGSTWQIDIGVLNPSGNQQTLAGRYPNVVIHNPQGNTNPANAYLAYLGTWLPFDLNGSWDGHFTGVARLDNNASTFTENIQSPNNSEILIATALCNGKHGEFWAVNFSTEPFNNTETPNGILLFKGTWNPTGNDVDWVTYDTIVPPYDKVSANGQVFTGSVDIAFDPTGRYGWMAMLADCSDSSKSDIEPVFYSSTDSGATWQGPVILKLTDYNNVVAGIPTQALYPTPAGSDVDMVVDLNGNPHAFFVVGGAASDTTIFIAGLKIYDFTYDRANTSWQAVFIDRVQTFRGDLAVDDQGQAITEFNRPQASLSPDGRKVFIAWLDSDSALTGGTNEIPNFITRGYDVISGLATPTVNWTRGDLRWEGGALFASTSPKTIGNPGTYIIPTVFTELNQSGLGTDPVNFHYVQNVQHTDADFTTDILCPYVTLSVNAPNPQYVYLGTVYSDPGATAVETDCSGGTNTITSGIISDASTSVNTSSRGEDTVTYTYTDTSGVTVRATRIVRINTEPDPNFGYTFSGARVIFKDSTLYSPTKWSWNFGDQFLSPQQNPQHTYAANGTYNVCLKAENLYNQAPFSKPVKEKCKSVTVTQVGIADAYMENSFSVYPNPSSGLLSIEVNSGNFEKVTVSVLDMVGREIKSMEAGAGISGKKFSLDLSSAGEGIYFIKIQTEQGVAVKRTIISR